MPDLTTALRKSNFYPNDTNRGARRRRYKPWTWYGSKSDWLKQMLVSGIMSNLTGMFDTINN